MTPSTSRTSCAFAVGLDAAAEADLSRALRGTTVRLHFVSAMQARTLAPVLKPKLLFVAGSAYWLEPSGYSDLARATGAQLGVVANGGAGTSELVEELLARAG